MFYFFREFDAMPEWVGKITKGKASIYFACDVMVHKRNEIVEVYPLVEDYEKLFFIKRENDETVLMEGYPTTLWPDVTYYFDDEIRKKAQVISL